MSFDIDHAKRVLYRTAVVMNIMELLAETKERPIKINRNDLLDKVKINEAQLTTCMRDIGVVFPMSIQFTTNEKGEPDGGFQYIISEPNFSQVAKMLKQCFVGENCHYWNPDDPYRWMRESSL